MRFVRLPFAVTALCLVLACAVFAAQPAQPDQTAQTAQVQAGVKPQRPAKPTAVTVFPASALVEVKEPITPKILPSGESGLVIVLPQQAYTGTFSIAVQGNSPASLSWETTDLSDDTGSGPRASVQAELSALRSDRNALAAQKAAAEARIAFWAKPETGQFTSAAELEKVDAAMEKNIRPLTGAIPAMVLRLEELDARIRKVQAKLAGLGAQNRSLHIVTVALAAPASAPRNVTYSYQIGGCGWSPAYRFEALPAKELLRFSQEAVVHQSTGFDWRGVQLNVATVPPSSRLSPQPLPAWFMQAREKEKSSVSVDMRVRASAPVADMKMAEESAKQDSQMAGSFARQAPVRDERTTFAVWKLGERVLPTGETIRVPLEDTEWKAAYNYTLRPMRERDGFLAAVPELPAPLELRRGSAVFVLDGVILSSVPNYAFSGDEMTVFFGTDPLVTSQMRLVKRVGGKKGIVNQDRTELWQWEIKVSNGRPVPVVVTVEDPIPTSGNDAIKLKVTSAPQPEKDKGNYVWKADIKPRDELVITHGVEARVPKNMDFFPGR